MNADRPPDFVPYGNQRTKSAGRRVDANIAATAKWFRERDAQARQEQAAPQVAAAPAMPVPDDVLADATHVFDSGRKQWREVVKVNAKTVTVATGYSWTDRVPKARITDARRVDTVHAEVSS